MNVITTTGFTFHRPLIDMVTPYAVGCVQRIKTNKGLNSYDGEHVSTRDIESMLLTLINDFCSVYKGSTNSTDVLKAMIVAAKGVRKENVFSYKQQTIDAVLTDFINFVAKTFCKVSLNLHADDLPKKLA